MTKISPILVTIIEPNFVFFCHQFWWKFWWFEEIGEFLSDENITNSGDENSFQFFVSFCHHFSVTCESLVSREFSRVLLTFHFLISISRHFHFTFHSRSQGIFISLFILEMSETDFHFTFHFSKLVNQIFISLFTSQTFNIHSRRTLPLLVNILWKRIIFWKFNQREWR